MDKKATHQVSEARIDLMDGTGIAWSRESDGMDNVQVSESNVLVVRGENELILAIYSPMLWATVNFSYEPVA